METWREVKKDLPEAIKRLTIVDTKVTTKKTVIFNQNPLSIWYAVYEEDRQGNRCIACYDVNNRLIPMRYNKEDLETIIKMIWEVQP